MADSEPYLITVKPMQRGLEQYGKIYIDSDEVTIGCGLENKFIIPHIQLSGRHCIIKKSLDQWVINDTSTYGILVNKKYIVKNKDHVLKGDDLIQLDFLGDFIYKFIWRCDDLGPPRLRRRLDETNCTDNLKVQFEESQRFAIEHMERKIQNIKQLRTNSTILKEHLEINMAQKMQQLKDGFKEQIENLRGERDQIEKQKLSLELERDKQLWELRNEMSNQIVELIQKIEKFNQNESELLKGNSALKDKMVVEHEQFLSKLNCESTSKQSLFEQLTTNIKAQQEIRFKEILEFEEQLKCQLEYFKATNDKELQNKIETVQKLRLEQLLQAREVAEKEAAEIANKNAAEAADEPAHKEYTLKVFGALLESELQCSICSELFMKSTILNCSHTFCEYCINKWAMQRNECPVCRAVITTKCHGLALDTFIAKMVQNLTEEMRIKREQMLKDRQDIVAESTRRRVYRRVPLRDYVEEIRDEDDSLSSISSFESLHETTDSEFDPPSMRVLLSSVEVVPGLPGARYGGYGRCRKCRQFGHWARGCPF